jgi:hypothetical protein
MRRSLPAIFALLAACGGGDSSKPLAPPPEVAVTTSVASISAPALRYILPARSEVACDATLKAEGAGEGAASWLDGSIEFYDLRDTTRMFGSVPIEASEMKSAWRQDTIAAGQVEQSRWWLTASTAFGAVFRLRFQQGTSTRTTSVWLRCAPPTAKSGTPAPSITLTSVNPSSGSIAALTPINLSFTATAPAGALLTVLRATGPCVAEWGWTENFATSFTYTAPLTLGYPCQLGVPIRVDVVTYDAMGSAAAAGQATTVTMTDTERPTVVAAFLHRGALDYLGSPYGQWTVPDTLWAEVHVRDNYKVEALFLEVYPFGVADTVVLRDSLVDRTGEFGLPTHAINRFRVVLRPEWAGTKLQFRYYGRDAQGMLSNVYTTEAGCVSIASPSGSVSTSAGETPVSSRLLTASSPCIYNVGDPMPAVVPPGPSLGSTMSTGSALMTRSLSPGSALEVLPPAYSARAIP